MDGETISWLKTYDRDHLCPSLIVPLLSTQYKLFNQVKISCCFQWQQHMFFSHLDFICKCKMTLWWPKTQCYSLESAASQNMWKQQYWFANCQLKNTDGDTLKSKTVLLWYQVQMQAGNWSLAQLKSVRHKSMLLRLWPIYWPRRYKRGQYIGLTATEY